MLGSGSKLLPRCRSSPSPSSFATPVSALHVCADHSQAMFEKNASASSTGRKDPIGGVGGSPGKREIATSRGLSWSRRDALRRSVSSVSGIYTPAASSSFLAVSSSPLSSPSSPVARKVFTGSPVAGTARESIAASDAAAVGDSGLTRFHRQRGFQEARSSSAGSSTSTSTGKALASAGMESVAALAGEAVIETQGRQSLAPVLGEEEKGVAKEFAPPREDSAKGPSEVTTESLPLHPELKNHRQPGGSYETTEDGTTLPSPPPPAPVVGDKGSEGEGGANAGEAKAEPQTPRNRKESPLREIRMTLSRDELFEFGVLGPVSIEGGDEGEDNGDGGGDSGDDSFGRADDAAIDGREEGEAGALSASAAAADADVAADTRETAASSPVGELCPPVDAEEDGPWVKNEVLVEPGGEQDTSTGADKARTDPPRPTAVGAIAHTTVQADCQLDEQPAPAAGEDAPTKDSHLADAEPVGTQQQLAAADEAKKEAVAAPASPREGENHASEAEEAAATAVGTLSPPDTQTGAANGRASPICTASSTTDADDGESYMTPTTGSPPRFWSAVGDGENSGEKTTTAGEADQVGANGVSVETRGSGVGVKGPAEASAVVVVPRSESEESMEAAAAEVAAAEAAAPRRSFFEQSSPAAAASPAANIAAAAAAGQASSSNSGGGCGGQRDRATAARTLDGTRLLSMESFKEITSGDTGGPSSSPRSLGAAARLGHVAEEAKKPTAGVDAAVPPSPSGIAVRPRAAKAASPLVRAEGGSGSPPRTRGTGSPPRPSRTPPRARKPPAPGSPGDVSVSRKQPLQQYMQAARMPPKQNLPSPLNEAEVAWPALSPCIDGSSTAAAPAAATAASAATAAAAAAALRSPRRRPCLSPGPSKGTGGCSPRRRLSGSPGPRRSEVSEGRQLVFCCRGGFSSFFTGIGCFLLRRVVSVGRFPRCWPPHSKSTATPFLFYGFKPRKPHSTPCCAGFQALCWVLVASASLFLSLSLQRAAGECHLGGSPVYI